MEKTQKVQQKYQTTGHKDRHADCDHGRAGQYVEHGRFSDPRRTYVVTNSCTPDTIRVFAGEPEDAEMVCTISNLSIRPIPAWSAKYHCNMSGWKQRFADEAVRVYRTSPHSHAGAGLRCCDG